MDDEALSMIDMMGGSEQLQAKVVHTDFFNGMEYINYILLFECCGYDANNKTIIQSLRMILMTMTLINYHIVQYSPV